MRKALPDKTKKVSGKLSNPSTEIVAFKPTPAMIVWVDTAIDLCDSSPTAVSEKSGLERTNWYKWLELPGFEDWFFETYKQKRRRWLPTLDKIGMANAKRDYNYWRDMNKKLGELTDDGTKVQVNFVQMLQQQKDKYGI